MNWECPYCRHKQTVTGEVSQDSFVPLLIGESGYGRLGIGIKAIRCVNADCNLVTISARLSNYSTHYGEPYETKNLLGFELLPRGASKPQPEYIPEVLRADYEEACVIRDLSPKASATLSRRCLQGMIRDFCGISKSRLIDEINELRKQIENGTADRSINPDTLEAIDAVRQVGNIGAHMEKDIDLIVEVDPGEAQALIDLIELLFEEWYVARHTRQQKVKSIAAMASAKQAQLAEQKAAKALAQLEAPDAPEDQAGQ